MGARSSRLLLIRRGKRPLPVLNSWKYLRRKLGCALASGNGSDLHLISRLFPSQTEARLRQKFLCAAIWLGPLAFFFELAARHPLISARCAGDSEYAPPWFPLPTRNRRRHSQPKQNVPPSPTIPQRPPRTSLREMRAQMDAPLSGGEIRNCSWPARLRQCLEDCAWKRGRRAVAQIVPR